MFQIHCDNVHAVYDMSQSLLASLQDILQTMFTFSKLKQKKDIQDLFNTTTKRKRIPCIVRE